MKSLQTDGQTDRRIDGRTDYGPQVIRKAHMSFKLWLAKIGDNMTNKYFLTRFITYDMTLHYR